MSAIRDPFSLLQRGPVKRKRSGSPRRGRELNDDYRMWITTLPCVVCKKLIDEGEFNRYQKSPTEAAHSGPHAMGQKADDRQCLPLCGIEHHREGPLSYHRLGRSFFERHGIDREAAVADYNARYELERGPLMKPLAPGETSATIGIGKSGRRELDEWQ